MLIEVLLVIALPLLGTFVITDLRKVADSEPLDLSLATTLDWR